PTTARGSVPPASDASTISFGLRPPSSCLAPGRFCRELTVAACACGRTGLKPWDSCKDGRLQVVGWLRNQGTIDGRHRLARLHDVEPLPHRGLTGGSDLFRPLGVG